ncbi:MAG: topology modulation protein [Eubacteriales bacterium]|nr:topology modulation protein [Eubacteriales bacterium]
MERVLIVGCGGSGKSTLARELGSMLSLPIIHLDRLFWQEGWHNVTNDVFDARLAEVLAQPRWIIDGNYDRTLPLRISRCDTVIALNYSRAVCLRSVAKRVLLSHGRTRPDMAGGCPERVDWAFLQWIWAFNREKRPQLLAMLSEAARNGVTVLTFNHRRECRKWVRTCPPVSAVL